MNREIKFRAWDKENKCMVFFDEWEPCVEYKALLLYATGSSLVNHDLPGAYTSKDPERKEGQYTLMQFTGLKDKNGKEIYEGDIVAWPGWDGKKYQVCYDRWGIPALAGIVDCEGMDFKEAEIKYNATPTKCVVLGNIYENPELLKENRNGN